jgi:hypothetical protein
MKHIDPIADDRLLGPSRKMDRCVYCGGPPETTEHVPARFFLDAPLPENLHTVLACKDCNNGFSADEQYLACLIDVTLVGSVSNSDRLRAKVRRSLEDQPALAASLNSARHTSGEGLFWVADMPRIERVLSKLAQGHAAYDLSELMLRPPDQLSIGPLMALSSEQRRPFETDPTNGYWPEVGTRAMQRMALGSPELVDGWVVVQPGRYRYLASTCPGVLVRIVLSEYLDCEARWD